ncbi:MAG: hypothetical protein WBX30_23505, partial [Stellaceae bacterium]
MHLDAHTDSYGYDPNAKYNATTQFTPRAPKPPPTSFTGGEMNFERGGHSSRSWRRGNQDYGSCVTCGAAHA